MFWDRLWDYNIEIYGYLISKTYFYLFYLLYFLIIRLSIYG